MHEITKSESEDRLAGALRQLAHTSDRVAPPEVAAALAGAFRQYHRRRKTRNAAAIALSIGIGSGLWFLTNRAEKPVPQVVERAMRPLKTAKDSPAPIPPKNVAKNSHRHHGSSPIPVQHDSARADEFLPLPSYDPGFNSGELQIIRVEMPLQDLRLVGVPVNVELPNRPVMADFVVGQDGIPYAIRLVQ